MALVLLTLAAAFGPVAAISARSSAPLSSVNQSAWDALSLSVGGRLHDGEPLLAPCYTRYNGKFQFPDAQECSVLQKNRSSVTFVSDHFGGYQNANWGSCQATGQSCSFGLTSPDLVTPLTRTCWQGSVPSKYVDAQSVEDVQKTLVFANKNNLRLVVKNTGHDYMGRSSGPGSLALWTHNLRPPIELNKNFVPEGCSAPAGDVLTWGAGQQFMEIYEFAYENGYRVVGGSSSTVGAAGGWITGGGHSMLSNELGLGVDNVQQLKAVLPDGSLVTANRCQNQDLFFALRGGGGSTFGVITEMSHLAHPEKPMVTAVASFFDLNANSASEFIKILVANGDKWASEGWGGYIQPGLIGNGVSSFFMATSMLNQSAAEASMKPVMDFAKKPGTFGSANVTATDSYFDILGSLVTGGINEAGGGSVTMSSRIVRRESFLGAANQSKLSSILSGILKSSQEDSLISVIPLFICVTAPTIYSQNMPESDKPGGPGDSAVTPAWRDGLWHVIHIRNFDGLTTDPAKILKTWQATHDAMNPLREFTPGSGAYQNEADAFETDPISAFWGQENYDRLLEIKKKVDPTNLLSVHNGVGWDKTDERFSCYPDVEL